MVSAKSVPSVFPPVPLDFKVKYGYRLAHNLRVNPGRRSPRQNRQDKNNSFLAQPQFLLTFFPSVPSLGPSQHQYLIISFFSGRLNLATLVSASHLVSFSQQSVSVDMASEKTPEVGDKGTWSFLQRVAREQPFSFCGF